MKSLHFSREGHRFFDSEPSGAPWLPGVPDASQMPPTSLPDTSQMFPGCLPDGSQMSPRCLQMPPDASRCFQMPPDASRCLQMPPDASRCVQMPPDASIQMPPDASRCFQMPPDVSRCLQMPPDASRCFQMLPDASQMFTHTQTSSHRVNSAGDHKKQLFGVARRSHIYIYICPHRTAHLLMREKGKLADGKTT